MSTRKCGRWSTSGPEEIQLRWDIISGFSDGLFDLDKPDFMSLYIKSKFTKMIQMIHSKAMWGIPFQITELFWASGANAQAASHILLFDGYLLFVTLMVDLTLCYRILPKKGSFQQSRKINSWWPWPQWQWCEQRWWVLSLQGCQHCYIGKANPVHHLAGPHCHVERPYDQWSNHHMIDSSFWMLTQWYWCCEQPWWEVSCHNISLAKGYDEPNGYLWHVPWCL